MVDGEEGFRDGALRGCSVGPLVVRESSEDLMRQNWRGTFFFVEISLGRSIIARFAKAALGIWSHSCHAATFLYTKIWA